MRMGSDSPRALQESAVSQSPILLSPCTAPADHYTSVRHKALPNHNLGALLAQNGVRNALRDASRLRATRLYGGYEDMQIVAIAASAATTKLGPVVELTKATGPAGPCTTTPVTVDG